MAPPTLRNIVKELVYFKSSESMKEIASEKVQAVITSPPYWNLKDYEHTEQIGHGEGYEKYHQRLNGVWAECKRVLKRDGTLWIVVDKIHSRGEVLHIPFDIVRNCRELGLLLQDIIVWNKPTAIAGMNPINLVNKYEYVLMFSRSKSFKVNNRAGVDVKAPDRTTDNFFSDLWRIPVKAGSIRKTPNHEAPFPEELIHRIISICSDKDDLILDPFMGSGTTLKAALELERKCTGYEINSEFAEMIADRLLRLENSLSARKLTDYG